MALPGAVPERLAPLGDEDDVAILGAGRFDVPPLGKHPFQPVSGPIPEPVLRLVARLEPDALDDHLIELQEPLA